MNIRANELRLGNLIQFNNFIGDERNVTVNARFFSSMAGGRPFTEVEGSNNAELNNYYSGIVLTPEILEKCGFYYKPCGISGADMWQGMGFWYRVKELPNQEFLLRGDFSRKRPLLLKLVGWFNSNIEHLHQLQNIYFAITGQELEVKL